ncbi:hypothetical protein GOP47_0020846 [Adiantum capillus-veneris]|uniref:Coiled-coil domain-containing protein 61 n=1 Tax=Adiantum capillus-veneris TaxID=13818 RepID=A0A9D4U9Y2_ADICA|nr:hypothetical protein GOP47_0020846 [Adiantum capillus-veneris]
MDASERNNNVRNNVGALQHQGELTFQNLRYIITVLATTVDILTIEAEQKSDGARWRGSFSSRNIEDMTQRTGNYKKFSVFVKMLYSAILQDSDSVFVDLLTYSDLESLKSRKTRISDRLKPSFNNNKRYLILTYIGEFDRIHYPLPLAQEEILEPDILRRTIKRLRIEVESLRKQLDINQGQGIGQDSNMTSTGVDQDEKDKLRTENRKLLTQLRCLEDSMIQHLGYKENSIAEHDNKSLAKDLAVYQKKSRVLHAKLESKMLSQKDIQALEDKVGELQHALKMEKDSRKRWVANLTKEKLALAEQVCRARESERAMRLRFREVEREMEHLKRRLKLQGIYNVEGIHGRIRANSLLGSRKTTPLHSRESSPYQTRCAKNGSRASSCPTFDSPQRTRLNIKEDLRLPIYRDYLTRASTSLPSSACFRDSPGYGSSGTAKQGDQYVKRLSPSLKSVHGNLSEQKGKMSKNRKHEASSGSSGSPSNFSVRSTRSNIVEKKVGGMHKINRTHTNSAASFFTPEGENQEHNAALSPRTSSPRKVLQQVKAKLAEYARLQGLS